MTINIFYGPIVSPTTLTHFSALPCCLLAVAPDGNIAWIEDTVDASDVHDKITQRGLHPGQYDLVDLTLKPGQFLMPGLVDTHVHACQFPLLGVGGDLQLLQWLNKYVFPEESKFEDDAYAQRVYTDVIHRSIASGTTTSCYYGSLHLQATKTLANIIHDKGQRAFVGKCNMDWNCPGYYIEKTPDVSIKDTKALITHIQSLPVSPANEPLVHPIITPRFALSCSDELLEKLCALAAEYPHLAIQTHISENRREVENACRRFDAPSYASIYDRFGLLRQNTVLGHGVWLTEDEMRLIAQRGGGVAHCPTSNFYLGSGMAKVGALLDHGVKVGLGTDVSGGYNPSLLYTVQMASTASKMVAVQAELEEDRRRERRLRKQCCKHRRRKHRHHVDTSGSDSDSEAEMTREHKHAQHGGHADPIKRQFTNKKLELDTLFYLATLGGAHVCCLEDRIGSFAVGKAFDALHVSLDAGNPAVWGPAAQVGPEEEDVRRWLERFLFGGDNRNVRGVWVQGVLVGGEEHGRVGNGEMGKGRDGELD